MIRPVQHIGAMSPYALAQLDVPAGKSLISLSQNESLRPPSPLAIKAAAAAVQAAHMYPDPEWVVLREALSELHDIPAEGILCGNGSMELIGCLTQAYADDKNAVLAPAHAYPFFRTATALARARFDTAPEEDGRVCVDNLLNAVQPDTRIVFVANPGNPTGTFISRQELVRLRDGLASDILLVIDEAYGEFADHRDAPMFDLVERGNTVVLRTLSKAYGLAGQRVGWGLFPPAIAREVRKIMNPNNISLAGQASASAAIIDQTYMRETCDMTAQLRDRFRDRLMSAEFDVPESFTNFVLIRFASAEQVKSVDAYLKAEGAFLRPQNGAGLAHCLRATIASAEDLNTAAGLLESWKKEETS
ncbi:MAG: histidinol-phosphate transaminase [Paracoccaceae bacterium]|nr:histidinol-phosphate transaminase [Paracoccaceae bacterium]MDG1738461.1 histidinol-phosphate transaminase [Paracoccaceae bacterium]MDG2259792.1 histidinol-phosphate transaminase [Paracoccaceae bacterium]